MQNSAKKHSPFRYLSPMTRLAFLVLLPSPVLSARMRVEDGMVKQYVLHMIQCGDTMKQYNLRVIRCGGQDESSPYEFAIMWEKAGVRGIVFALREVAETDQ